LGSSHLDEGIAVKLQFLLHDLPWNFFDDKPDNPKMKKLRQRLNEMFARYNPRRLSEKPKQEEYRKHEIEVPADDAEVEKLIRELSRELKSARAAGQVWAIPTAAELARARWVPLLFYATYVDDDSNGRPLNQFGRVMCEKCKCPDLASIPEPYLVNRNVLKSAEIFPTSDGVIVVRQRVLDLLKSAIGGQIESGEAKLAKGASGGEKFRWVRPKHHLGGDAEDQADVQKTCSKCARATARRARSFDRKAQLYDSRLRLPEFGDPKVDLAVMDFYGTIFPDGTRRCYWPMAISGSLFAHLKANGVKAIATAPGGEPPACYFSKKGEPTLEAATRTYAAPGGKAAKGRADRVEEGRKIVEGLKDIPWDHEKDGHVYFYLTTPRLVMLDPMTWEEDGGGPYELKAKGFKRGLYRVPVSAVRAAHAKGKKSEKARGVAVDSASVVIIDNAFYADLAENFEWDKCTGSSGRLKTKYLDEVARRIGNRFGFCTAPGVGSGHDFEGDGLYVLDVKQIERAK
jgi:hypothetical protein